MATKQNFVRILCVTALAALAQATIVAPAAAQSGENCLCIVPTGTVGKVTSISGWVKVNGKAGLVDAAVDAPLSVGSVLRTGVAGKAGAMVGETCNVVVSSVSQLSISKLDENRMCVRLNGKVAGAPLSTVAVAGGGALLGGGLIVVSLGQDNPVSK